MATIHLVLGPVGAGKSTYALELSKRRDAVRLTLDDWFTTLFSPDRPESALLEWYGERSGRCIEQIWKVAQQLIALGTDVILEIGLIRRGDREEFYEKIDSSGLDLHVHVLDAPRAVRRERVLGRNEAQGETFSMIVPENIFELASDMWEPLEGYEREGKIVVDIS